MRSFILVALVAAAAQVSAAHVPHVPHRARHVGLARDLKDGAGVGHGAEAPKPQLRRRKRCPARHSDGLTSTNQVSSTTPPDAPSRPAPTAPASSSVSRPHHESPPSLSSPSSPASVPSSSSPAPKPPKHHTKPTQNGGATNVGTAPTSTQPAQDDGPAPSKTQDGAVPTSTVTSSSDPFLKRLSDPLNYKSVSFFRERHTGDMTFYGQGQTACGDVYDDSTFTAAISQHMYDNWPGADSATNRNNVCGPWVEGRAFLTPDNVVVPGRSVAVLGGDGLLNCAQGKQCHRPLTATVFHNGNSVRVAIVDRCVGCAKDDIDLAPAAFLKLTRPDLDLSKIPTDQLMTEALKDHQGRISGTTWQFDSHQSYGPVVRV